MRHHARAVILLGGWLLMTPPFTRRGGKVELDTDAPVSKWSQDSAYDSAVACEHGRIDLYSGFKEKGEKDKSEIYVQTRCVPAEAIYPPKPPTQK